MRDREFEAFERMYQNSVLLVAAASYAVSSALVLVSLRLTFFMTGVVQLAAAVMMALVPDLRGARTTAARQNTGLTEQVKSLARLADRNSLTRDILAMVLVGTGFSILLYLVPLYYIDAGLTESRLGILAATAAVGAAMASHLVGSLKKLWSIRVALAAIAGSCALLLISNNVVILFVAIVLQVHQALFLPRFRSHISTYLREIGDSMALSVVTTTRNLGFAVIAPFIGILITTIGMRGLSLTCTAFFVVSTALVTKRFGSRGLHLEPNSFSAN
jgi:predicted MFS family arabinose efflux permease